jgi:hypothetical protein
MMSLLNRLLLILIISLVHAGCKNRQKAAMELVAPVESVQTDTIQHEVKVEDTLECQICFEDKHLISHSKNKHQFCVECTRLYLEHEIEQGNCKICCPGQCNEALSEKDIKKYLRADKFLTYEALSQEECVSQAIDNGDLDGFEKCPDVCHPF